MSPCPFAHHDAAYVLGALPPDEHRAFEEHLASCATCPQAVRELAVLPGLLSRADPTALGDVEAAPPTLLPRLLGAASAQRRRTRRTYWLVAACLVLVLAVAIPAGWAVSRPDPRPPAASQDGGDLLTLKSVVPGIRITATVRLTDVRWGTKVHMRCAYAPENAGKPRPYILAVVSRDGTVDELGSWTVAPGEDSQFDAPTRYRRAELSAVEIRTIDGRPLLRASLR